MSDHFCMPIPRAPPLLLCHWSQNIMKPFFCRPARPTQQVACHSPAGSARARALSLAERRCQALPPSSSLPARQPRCSPVSRPCLPKSSRDSGSCEHPPARQEPCCDLSSSRARFEAAAAARLSQPPAPLPEPPPSPAIGSEISGKTIAVNEDIGGVRGCCCCCCL